LSAWWNNASYKEARHAEERLLRRMEMFRPTPVKEAPKGWFGWTGTAAGAAATATTADQPAPDLVSEPTTTGGLVATLRNVFIPTPVPERAPLHPADPFEPIAGPTASPRSSISEKSKKCKKDDKFVDYINTLEISSSANKTSKEAVVVLHGYAAAMG
jgi:cardiolipin-specific phospholipase